MVRGACDALAVTETLIKKKKKILWAAFPEGSQAEDGGWAATSLQWFLSCSKKGGHVF